MVVPMALQAAPTPRCGRTTRRASGATVATTSPTACARTTAWRRRASPERARGACRVGGGGEQPLQACRSAAYPRHRHCLPACSPPTLQNVITPTTKAVDHDEPISPAEIISQGLMSSGDWEAVSAAALRLFAFGQAAAAARGLLLVDTKYEFGKDAATGEILLIDEIHTPDSSRYWLADSYEQRHAEVRRRRRRRRRSAKTARWSARLVSSSACPARFCPAPCCRAQSPRTSTRNSCGSGSGPTATRTTMRCGTALLFPCSRLCRRCHSLHCTALAAPPNPRPTLCCPPLPLLLRPPFAAGAARGAGGAGGGAVPAVRAAVRKDHGAAL